jgi:hypothetical protein
MNSGLYNFVIHHNSNNTTISYGPSYPSLMLQTQQQQQQQQSFNDSYTALILEEAEKIYNKLITELTNRAISASAAGTIRASPLPSIGNDNKQKLINNNNTYDEGE